MSILPAMRNFVENYGSSNAMPGTSAGHMEAMQGRSSHVQELGQSLHQDVSEKGAGEVRQKKKKKKKKKKKIAHLVLGERTSTSPLLLFTFSPLPRTPLQIGDDVEA